MAKWLDSGGLTGRQMLDMPPVWMLGALGLIWMQARVFPQLVAPFDAGPVIGGALVVLGIGLAIWAALAFRAHQTSVVPHQVPNALITSGPFALSRNPIYLGDVLVLVGAVVWLGAWAALIWVVAFVFLINRRFIAPEEARLEQHFRDTFASYAAKTRRWI